MDRFLVFYTYKGEVKNIIILANNKTDALKAMDYYDIIEIFYHDDMGKEDVKELEDFYKDKMTDKTPVRHAVVDGDGKVKHTWIFQNNN